MRYSLEQIERITETIRHKYASVCGMGKALDAKALATHIGGRIEQTKFVDIGAETMRIHGAKQAQDGHWESISFTIRVSESDSPYRQNFAVAHALGHLYLQYLKAPENERITRFYRISHIDGGVQEIEANLFAGALLMPRREYSEAYQFYKGDLSKLSEAFHVSIPAAEIRASILKLNQGHAHPQYLPKHGGEVF